MLHIVFEQPVRQPHPDFDAGLAGRIIRNKEFHTVQEYLDAIHRDHSALIEPCPHDEIPFRQVISTQGVEIVIIFNAHPQGKLYRYRLQGEADWSYVILWEADSIL